MKETIGFIGLGEMGQPMALNLLKSGYALKVYNRTASKTEPLVARGAESVSQPNDVLSAGGVVVSMVKDDAALQDIVMSPGFLEQLGQGGIHLSMSTISPVTAHKLVEVHAKQGSQYVDAPVFGIPEAAAAQKLLICFAGPQAAKERVRPLLEAMGQGVFDFGEVVGAATLVKLSGNYINFVAAQALGEVLDLAKRSGMDPMKVVDMFTQTLFPIEIYQDLGERLAHNPNLLSGSWIALKDVGLFEETAIQEGSPVPLARRLYSILTKNVGSSEGNDTHVRSEGE